MESLRFGRPPSSLHPLPAAAPNREETAGGWNASAALLGIVQAEAGPKRKKK